MTKRFKWTDELDARLKDLYARKLTWRTIKTRIGCTQHQAEHRAKQLNIIRPPEERKTKLKVITITADINSLEILDKWLLKHDQSRSRYFQLLLERDLKLKRLL